MKISIISPFFPHPRRGKFYGVERYTENLALSLSKLGNEIKVITTFWNGGSRYETYKGIKILRVRETGSIFNFFGPFDTLHYISFGISVLRKKNFKFYQNSDILLLNIPIIFSRVFKLKNIPVISLFHHFI